MARYAKCGDLEMNLDAGCGGNLFYEPTTYETHPSILKPDVSIDILLPTGKKSTAFVRASVTRMPFRSKVFTKTTCIHVLEHLTYTEIPDAVRELRRVSQSVTVKFPRILFNVGMNHSHASIFMFGKFYPYMRLMERLTALATFTTEIHGKHIAVLGWALRKTRLYERVAEHCLELNNYNE